MGKTMGKTRGRDVNVPDAMPHAVGNGVSI